MWYEGRSVEGTNVLLWTPSTGRPNVRAIRLTLLWSQFFLRVQLVFS
jgi:hypothetical protein